MFDRLTLFLLFLLTSVALLTFAQSDPSSSSSSLAPSATSQPFPNIRPANIPSSGGRVGIVNRYVSPNSTQVEFEIYGLSNTTRYLEFQAEPAADGNGTAFRLIGYYGAMTAKNVPIFYLGPGAFKARLDGGLGTVNCHLAVKEGVKDVQNQPSKLFRFQPGGADNRSYLWPCGVQDWVEVKCDDPVKLEPSCDAGAW
ncbi:uncharacterized protein MKK02DRAFT_43166 [Dioszegia hungarica]|uniref:Uncharacterized protein n=1 Tax=Dioszegia hungarica TaxID=4972 RepID=A0AA38LXF9_9TREE|nr:uncharacterized protein MKK02DRAFT_43166 [Dioszegia hungarica]KAI9637246.1 hypothetical protein MKK02DRAFT_43166 [Dioszegia hungarica]